MVSAARSICGRTILFLTVLLVSLAIATVAHASCAEVVPEGLVAKRPARSITPLDLVRLRDIGFPDPSLMTGPSPLAVSPDGRSYAFVINQGDPETNGYCRALVVRSLDQASPSRVVDRGGELITLTDVHRGLFVPGGFPNLVTPIWSPDGLWIAYLRRDNGVTRVWRVRADGSAAPIAVTNGPDDVESVQWSANGRSLLFSARPGKLAEQAAIDREGRAGWLFDTRVVTWSGPRPQVRQSVAPLVWYSVDIESGRIKPTSATASSADAYDLTAILGNPEATASNGRKAWTEHQAESPHSPFKLHIKDERGNLIPCFTAMCGGRITGLWWSPSGDTLWVLHREGWADGEMALYTWSLGGTPPRRVLLTSDVLIGCVPAKAKLLCTREGTRSPRHVDLIDPATGRSETIFDPNPEFNRIALPAVQRLKWKNDLGLAAWGDLVLPTNYRPGAKLPVVVVQYHSMGFLRGGTGDDYPIYPFAAHGFAVLSVQRTDFADTLIPGLKTYDDTIVADAKDWAERKNQLSSLVTGVKQTIAMGVADPKRIGITGLSDGSTTVRYALINTRLFAAAAISTCCLEPKNVMTYGGIAYAEFSRRNGNPLTIEDKPEHWKPMSIAQNAKDIDVPILMQLDDDEWLTSLEAFEPLREYGKPVEIYVFPHEYHAKWQPIHRLAIYQRDLDWFDFWLQNRRDDDPAKADQYQRWETMRAARQSREGHGDAAQACTQASTSTKCMSRP